MSPYEWDPNKEEMVWVEPRGRRGRPKMEKRPLSWLSGGSEKDESELPPEIRLSDDASLEMMFVASFTNFLNGHEMDELTRIKLREWRIDAEIIASDRLTYSKQIQAIRDYIYKIYTSEITAMGNYMIGDTTLGMASVLSAMTGEHDKRGKLRE